MADKLIVVSFLLMATLLVVSRPENGAIKNIPGEGYEEEQFIKKYSVPTADIYKSVDNDSVRCYHIAQPDSCANPDFWFSWFDFKVWEYSDSTQARAAFEKKKRGGDHWKAPEYYLIYGRRHYSVSSGCFNVDKVDSLYHSFRDCLDTAAMAHGDVIRVECGGRWIADDGRTWPAIRP